MSMSFEAFYRQVTGHAPFAWQSRLATDVDAGRWPSSIALPTAAGKTSIVEIWAYALAHDIGRGLQTRRVPMRLIWVVDRRIVVDEVFSRASKLATMLLESETRSDQPLFSISSALRSLGGSSPLAVRQLRGGVAGQRQWAHAPNQPLVLATTVDQVGSRLLFRGYGVSSHQFSLEAGLLACDTLIVVDEAHLSQAFTTTLAAIRRLHSTAAHDVASALRLAILSATLPPGEESQQFVLTPAESAELAPRLARPKMATLISADKGTSHVDQLVAAAKSMLQQVTAMGGDVVAVITNRVDTARDVFTKLAADHDALLLTGRIRPHDRDALLATWLPRVRAGRSRKPGAAPAVVVATQTIEVGADFDFDALVTDVAPLSALRQRFGRLNRLGAHDSTVAEIVERATEDGVYPPDIMKAVWEWLGAHASTATRGGSPTINLSSDAVARLLEVGGAPADVSPADPPVLTAIHVQHWSQTSPAPVPDIEVSPFLHGKEKASAADVQLVWRADLLKDDFVRALERPEWRPTIEQRLSAQLDLAPPRIEEALGVPAWAVRKWLSGAALAGPIADLEAGVVPSEERSVAMETARPALRWDGRNAAIVLPAQIAPGDTIIIPTTYGGTDAFGWRPDSSGEVHDLGDIAGRKGRSRQRLRLHPWMLPTLLREGEDPAAWLADLHDVLRALDPEGDPTIDAANNAFDRRLADFVTAILPHLLSDVREALLTWQRSKGRWIPYPVAETGMERVPPGIMLEWVERGPDRSPDTDLTMDAADQSSMSGIGRTWTSRQVTLAEHSEAVATCARGWAIASGLSERIAKTLEWAGRLHDIGKCEPRFQLMLHGGDEVAAAAASEALAKSGIDPHDRVLQDQARRLARLPARMRHEAISAQLLLNAYQQLPADIDRDLLCYLVGSHHGRGRPWFPVVADPSPTQVLAKAHGHTFTATSATTLGRIDGGWVELFASLQRRYGAWGLSYLEATLRLADHWVSSQEAQA